MTKYELASYCASLLSIMESKDAAGGISRGATLGREYERAYAEMMGIIRKEEEDDARTREAQQSSQAGANRASDQSGLRGSAREHPSEAVSSRENAPTERRI